MFRVAFCADAPHLEYRCLSQAFLEDNGITGQLAYREFRERLLEAEPFLRYALAKARIVSIESTGPRSATLEARALGRTLRVRMVREDSWDIFADGVVWDGAYVGDIQAMSRVRELPGGGTQLEVLLPLEERELVERMTEVRLASEWKIRAIDTAGEEGSGG